MLEISKRTANIAASATLAVASKARYLKKNGVDVINLAMGEPDFDTPEEVKQEATAALRAGQTKYTDTAGIEELKMAIVEKIRRKDNITCSPEQVIVGSGAKQVLYNALSVLCNPGDEVLIVSPCWVSYAEQVKLVGAHPVFVSARADNRFIPKIEDLEQNISDKTKVLMINSPNNPTGAVYPVQFLKQLATLILKKGIAIISDDVYEELVFDGTTQQSIVSLEPALQNQTLIVNSMSKTYAMTGWRIGYAVAPKYLIKAMINFQSHTLGNVNTMAQYGATYALNSSFQFKDWIKEYNFRRQYCLQSLMAMPSITCVEPKGAFYVFPDCSALLERRWGQKEIGNSMQLVEYLLEDAHTAVVPGEAFNAPGYFRLSYATSMDNLRRAMDRIASSLAKLK